MSILGQLFSSEYRSEVSTGKTRELKNAQGTPMVGISIAQRRSGQDAGVIFEAPGEVLPPDTIMQGLKATAVEMSSKDAKENDCGACVSLAMGRVKDGKAEVHQFAAGDSFSTLFVFDKDNNLVSYEMLNRQLHQVDNPEELERIKRETKVEGQDFSDGRLASGLMVSRGWGDGNSKIFGHSSQVETRSLLFDVPEGHHVVIVNTSDAMLDRFKFDMRRNPQQVAKASQQVVKGIGEQVELQLKKGASPGAIAEALTTFADTGRKDPATGKSLADDATAQVIFLDDKMRGTFLADGHGPGGEILARRLVEKFPKRLANNMQPLVKAYKEQKTQEQKASAPQITAVVAQATPRPSPMTSVVGQAMPRSPQVASAAVQPRSTSFLANGRAFLQGLVDRFKAGFQRQVKTEVKAKEESTRAAVNTVRRERNEDKAAEREVIEQVSDEMTAQARQCRSSSEKMNIEQARFKMHQASIAKKGGLIPALESAERTLKANASSSSLPTQKVLESIGLAKTVAGWLERGVKAVKDALFSRHEARHNVETRITHKPNPLVPEFPESMAKRQQKLPSTLEGRIETSFGDTPYQATARTEVYDRYKDAIGKLLEQAKSKEKRVEPQTIAQIEEFERCFDYLNSGGQHWLADHTLFEGVVENQILGFPQDFAKDPYGQKVRDLLIAAREVLTNIAIQDKELTSLLHEKHQERHQPEREHVASLGR